MNENEIDKGQFDLQIAPVYSQHDFSLYRFSRICHLLRFTKIGSNYQTQERSTPLNHRAITTSKNLYISKKFSFSSTSAIPRRSLTLAEHECMCFSKTLSKISSATATSLVSI